MRRKDFCYDPIPEIWSDIDTQSQNICQILIPNRRSNKSKLTSKGLGIEGWERLFWFQVATGTRFWSEDVFQHKNTWNQFTWNWQRVAWKFIQLYFHSTPITEFWVTPNPRKFRVKVYPNHRNFPVKDYPNPRIFRPKTTQNCRTSPSYP